MGKPKKVKEKTKLSISSPKEGNIVKQKSRKKISKAKDELQPNETLQNVKIEEQIEEHIFMAKDEPQPSKTDVKERSQEQPKEMSSGGELVGFIFMCNTQTKPECYHHRVLGLPKYKEQVVLNIKRGAKLFLYDFDLKLLYGIYEASSNGGMNLEPNAFGGRYPAQVKFKVHTDCLPLAGHAFIHAIKEDGSTSKFRTELNAQQVETLCKLFQPMAGPMVHGTGLEPVQLAPALRDPIPLYPSSFPHHHVENMRRDAVPPPNYIQYGVTSQQQVPGLWPPRVLHYPVETGRHPVAAFEREQYGSVYRSVPDGSIFLSPLSAPEMVPHGRRLLHPGEYHAIPPGREMAPHYMVQGYDELGDPHGSLPSVGPVYREVVRVYAEPRTETSSMPVSSRYSFAGSVPLYR